MGTCLALVLKDGLGRSEVVLHRPPGLALRDPQLELDVLQCILRDAPQLRGLLNCSGLAHSKAIEPVSAGQKIYSWPLPSW